MAAASCLHPFFQTSVVVNIVPHCLTVTSHLGHTDTVAIGAFVDYQRFTELAQVMHYYKHIINT